MAIETPIMIYYIYIVPWLLLLGVYLQFIGSSEFDLACKSVENTSQYMHM